MFYQLFLKRSITVAEVSPKRRVQQLRDAYQKIHDTKDLICETYGLQMLGMTAYTFCDVVFSIFLVIVELRQRNQLSDSLLFLVTPVIHFTIFTLIAFLCDKVAEGCKNTGKILHSTCARTQDLEVRTEVSGFDYFDYVDRSGS